MRDVGVFNTANPLHIECLRFCFLPLIQVQLNQFVENWNEHRIRRQRMEVPSGIPNVLYFQPEIFGSTDYSFPLLCSNQTIDQFYLEHAASLPVRGCSEEFMQVVRYLTDEETNQVLVPQNLDETFQIFCVLIDICNGLR